MKTHYQILGVADDADHKTIQTAYYRAARKWHPDNHSSSSSTQAKKAEEAMRRVNQAWDVLGDKSKRRSYDRELIQRGAATPRQKAYSTDDGVTRIDPRLLDRDYLHNRRTAQQEEISNNHSSVLRAVPLVGIIGALLLVFVLSAYAGNDNTGETESTGPPLGGGIEVGDCVDITTGPGLIERSCTATADARVVGSATVRTGECPAEATETVVFANGLVACLGPLISGGG